MHKEISSSGRIILLKKGDELLLGRGLTALSESLEIALARFYRQSKTRIPIPASDEDSLAIGYESDPHLAVNDFGVVLAEKLFGDDGEQTFFEEFPSAVYFVLEGKGNFAHTSNSFYRVGLVTVATEGSGEIDLGIDPVYNRAETRAALFSTKSTAELFTLLSTHYGGNWKAENVFHPETGKYEWLENRTVKSFFPKNKSS